MSPPRQNTVTETGDTVEELKALDVESSKVVDLEQFVAGTSFFTLSKRKGLPHLSGSRPRDR